MRRATTLAYHAHQQQTRHALAASRLLSEVFQVELVSAILTIEMLESVSASRSSVLITALLALRITFALAAKNPCTEL